MLHDGGIATRLPILNFLFVRSVPAEVTEEDVV